MSEAAVTLVEPSKRRRIVKIVAWILGLVLLLVLLHLAGVDVWGWISELWNTLTDISIVYILLGCIFQALQTTLTALGWYGILRYAYPGGVTYMPVLASYAAGVALNNFLPANIGTFVTLVMYVAIVRGSTFPGILAGYLVQKIFYMVIGTLIYLYLFIQIEGSFDFRFGDERDAITNHTVLVPRDRRRRTLPRRAPPADLLAVGQGDVGEGEEGRRDPRRPRRLHPPRPAPADGRLRRQGARHHRLPRGVLDPGHLRVGDERSRLEPAREPALPHTGRPRRQPGLQRVRARELHELDDRHRLLARPAARHDGVQRRLRDRA
jgi:hypothetical protein